MWLVLDKEQYVVHIRTLKQEINHGFNLQKVHMVIKSNKKGLLNPYTVFDKDLRKRKQKKWL